MRRELRFWACALGVACAFAMPAQADEMPKYGGILVAPEALRQVFNDTEAEVLWLIVGAPEEAGFLPDARTKPDMSLIYPVDPKQLPKELAGAEWPPN